MWMREGGGASTDWNGKEGSQRESGTSMDKGPGFPDVE